MSNLITTQINQLATRFDLPQSEELYNVLKATAFKGDVSDAQLSALLIVASQYGLNPWTKEIYAFPDKKNGIIPVVSVDGWSRIINSHPAFDGMDFNFADEMVMMDGANSPAPTWTECVIHRKDRSHPTIIREYLDEVYKAPFKPKDGGYTVAGPWQTHPKRFSRHKAMIQAARLAFGFSGIVDQDEAERIVESSAPKQVNPDTGEIESVLFDVVGALNCVDACETTDALSAVWKAEGAKAVAAKDNAGHAALKAAVKEKKSALEAITTVEMAA